MAKPERRLSNRLGERLDLDFWLPVENTIGEGTPDIHFIHLGVSGWIELKHVKAYPKRPVTPIRFHRYTWEQAAMSEEIGRSGALSWVLIQVAADHWVFPWSAARELRLGQSILWWKANCSGYWQNRLDYEQLRKLIVSMVDTRQGTGYDALATFQK